METQEMMPVEHDEPTSLASEGGAVAQQQQQHEEEARQEREAPRGDVGAGLDAFLAQYLPTPSFQPPASEPRAIRELEELKRELGELRRELSRRSEGYEEGGFGEESHSKVRALEEELRRIREEQRRRERQERALRYLWQGVMGLGINPQDPRYRQALPPWDQRQFEDEPEEYVARYLSAIAFQVGQAYRQALAVLYQRVGQERKGQSVPPPPKPEFETATPSPGPSASKLQEVLQELSDEDLQKLQDEVSRRSRREVLDLTRIIDLARQIKSGGK